MAENEEEARLQAKGNPDYYLDEGQSEGLWRRIDDLKAEVERLRAENADLREDRDTFRSQLLVCKDRRMREDLETRDEIARLREALVEIEKYAKDHANDDSGNHWNMRQIIKKARAALGGEAAPQEGEDDEIR